LEALPQKKNNAFSVKNEYRAVYSKKRIYKRRQKKKRKNAFSSPAIKIAIAGIAFGIGSDDCLLYASLSVSKKEDPRKK